MGVIKVQGDNRGSFIVVTKRISNMSKNPVSTVKLVSIFDHQVELVAKNCDELLQDYSKVEFCSFLITF